MSAGFSPRQAEIVALIAGGLEDKEIARQLGVSVTTVRTHLQRLYRNIGVHNRSVATVKWLELEESTMHARPSVSL
ncbi:MAG TPA: LuxR C-terminal-related transcriptional regulator [Candidatus Dormibacteraeota bacterium]